MLDCRTKPTCDEKSILIDIEWINIMLDPNTLTAAEISYEAVTLMEREGLSL